MRNHYASVASTIKASFESSGLWRSLTGQLADYDEEYLLETGYALLGSREAPAVLIKPFDSFLLKTFRRNVLENALWPNEPAGGWILPDNWYSRVGDVVRTWLVVKYLDGIEFISARIGSLCEKESLRYEVSLEAREEGYYAAHVNVWQPTEVPKLDWDTEIIAASIEIQLTTQLQDVIRKLLHKYYEERRQRIGEPRVKWQWEYKSDEFVTNYLGHILHYAEGMIMEVRERQSG